MQHIAGLPGYHDLMLREVKDTNAPALGRYRTLGLIKYRRRQMRFARRAGFSECCRFA